MVGVIYFDYDEEQFRQWVPLEPFTDMSEYDCVSASCVAVRLRPSADLRKMSRACNRMKTGIFLSDMETFGVVTRCENKYDEFILE